jgi:hypothetical protein
MKKYYKLMQSPSDKFRIQTSPETPKNKNGVKTDFLSGRSIPIPKTQTFTLKINCPENVSPRHFIGGAELIVVSKLLLDCFRMAGVDNFEIWEARLHEPKTNRTWENYFIFNEIGLINAMSMSASKYHVIMDGVYAIRKIAFDSKKTKDKKMFRIPQSPFDLYISQDVIDVMDKFSPPEKWGVGVSEVLVV